MRISSPAPAESHPPGYPPISLLFHNIHDDVMICFCMRKTPRHQKTLIQLDFLGICAPVVTRFVTRYASEGHTSGLTRAPVRVARHLTGR